MRQKKFGKKIQNWHRPLRPSQLGRRFLEHRYDDPEIRKRGQSIDVLTGVDDCWDPFDPYQDWDDGELEDLYRLELDKFLTRTLDSSDPLFRPEWAADSSIVATTPSLVEPADLGVAERLAVYVEQVMLFSKNSEAVRSQILQAVGDPRSLNVLNSVGDAFCIQRYVLNSDALNFCPQPFAKRVCLFAPFWIRRPETWKKDGDRTLLDHLFSRYEVPEFLHAEWCRSQDVPRFKWLMLVHPAGARREPKTRSQSLRLEDPRQIPECSLRSPLSVISNHGVHVRRGETARRLRTGL